MKNFFNRAYGLEKLIQIVRESWNYLAKDIANGGIRINNEEDLELELGYILKKQGLYVGRQHPACLSTSTSKTASGKAKVDLYTALSDKHDLFTVAIELKCFPKHPGAPTTENRKAILKDVENLEAYVNEGIADTGLSMVYTTDCDYMDDRRSSVKINNTGHETKWLSFNNEQNCFLTIQVDNTLPEIRLNERMLVGEFTNAFREQFDGVLKVFADKNARNVVNERDTLGRVRIEQSPLKSGAIRLPKDILVRDFCERMFYDFGYVVRVYRRDGRVRVPDDAPLYKLGEISYQASKQEMEDVVRRLAKELDNMDLNTAANELLKGSRRARSRSEEEDMLKAADLMEVLDRSNNRRDYNSILRLFDKYPITELGGILASIVSGNYVGLGVETMKTITKLARLFNQDEENSEDYYRRR